MKATQQATTRPTDKSVGGQIICGTDFSIHAGEAVIAAAAIARRLRIPLLLVHVLDDSALQGSPEILRAQLRTAAEQKLLLEAARLRDRDVEVSTELLDGRPETELARVGVIRCEHLDRTNS